MHDFPSSDPNASSTEDPESAPAHFNGPPTQRCAPIAFADPWQDFWTSSIVPEREAEELGVMDYRETVRPTGEVDLEAFERHFAADSGVHRILSGNDDDRQVDSIEAAVLKLLTG